MKLIVDGEERILEEGETCAEVMKRVLSGKKFKSLVAVKAVKGENREEELLDLAAPVPLHATELIPVFADSPEGLKILRHSTAHVMASAVKKLFPEVKVAIGPAIENGFYYDFEIDKPFSTEDLAEIEKEMARLSSEALPFVHKITPKTEARDFFRQHGEKYKEELLDSIPEDEVGLYICGDFVDLCRGPHVPDTSFTRNSRLLSVAGAYWRGDEKNRMLSRIYGTAFANARSLEAYLHQLEEAKKRDHRKLGKELDYFHFEEKVAPGMVFWLPKGMLVRTILEDFWRREHLRRGYEIVQGPQLLRVEAWQTSGHYKHYKKNMYFTKIEEDEYGIKPMNCIGHMLIYQRDIHSYRDLPRRYFELGVVHRHEKSGVLHGLLRVRQFTQDDAHIICTPEQLQDEILLVINLIQDLMQLFDFQFKVAISTRPEESIGTDEAWELATGALIKAVEKIGLDYEINEGDGAFYGPKIDVSLLDSLGRQWQCSTIQVDFTMPERFDLTYVDKEGNKQRPIMVHRAIMGSVERFIGILLEHYAGALPVWLAPEQARILTVTEAADDAAKKMDKELQLAGLRVKTDLRNEKLAFKVREAQMAKVPFMLIVGEKEAQTNTLSVRLRDGENLGPKTVSEVADLIREAAEQPFKKGGMRYSFA